MTAMLEHLWTAADSEALDKYAVAHFTAPLRPDPELWDVFAEDRAEAPYIDGSHPGARITRGYKVRPTNCRECRRALRSRYQKPEDVPTEAVLHHGQGLCNRCYQKANGKWRNGEKVRCG